MVRHGRNNVKNGYMPDDKANGINGHNPPKLDVSRRNNLAFVVIPAAVAYIYCCLLVLYLGSVTLCGQHAQVSTSTLENTSVESISEDGRSCSRETRWSVYTGYELYHSGREQQKSTRERTDESERNSDAHEGSSDDQGVRWICRSASLVSYTRSVRLIVPFVLVESYERAPTHMHTQVDHSMDFSHVAAAHRSTHRKTHEQLRTHPIQRVVHAATSFFMKKSRKEKAKKKSAARKTASSLPSLSQGELSAKQRHLIRELSTRVRSAAGDHPDFDSRLAAIAWGGPTNWRWSADSTYRNWWSPLLPKRESDRDDGSDILRCYLRIMQWPEDLKTTFPFKLCSEGCDAERAILHTVEWREKFKPWLITPAVIREGSSYENRNGGGGWLYNRGFARDGSALVWYRPGIHKTEDPETYLRILILTLESAIADSLERSGGRHGKYHVIMDCDQFKFSSIPKLGQVKRAFTVLQDHFPNRLQILFIGNAVGAPSLFLKMVQPFMTESVKRKIQIIPNDSSERNEMLGEFMEPDNVPVAFGGTDNFTFNAEVYYGEPVASDEEGREYLVTMPYHA